MRHPRIPPVRFVLIDGALWGVLAAATGYGFRDAGGASLVMDLLLPLTVLAVAVPLSRTRPGVAVLLVNGLCALGLADAATPANAHVLSLAMLSCLLGVRVARGRGPLLVLASCLAVDIAACAVLRVPAVWWFYALTVLPTALLLPWLAGRHWRGRRELVREGWRLARSLQERQHLVAERARLTERADIAADMHDSLGHALSLVALRAGALELSPDLTEGDRADLAELRGTIADAVEQLRETVAVLHEPGTGPYPGTGPSGLTVKDTVEDLLGRAVASGVPVRWERRGAVPVLPPMVERGMYRVVQEALTNALKHAPDSKVSVAIDHEPDRTRVTVVNAAAPGAGAGQSGGQAADMGGRGLTGLRERVTVLGGTLRTGAPGRLPRHRRPPSPAPCPGDATRHRHGRRFRPGGHRTPRGGTALRTPPVDRGLRGAGRRGGVLRTGRCLPGLAADDRCADTGPVRRAGTGPVPHRAHPSAPGRCLPVPSRPRPFRPPTAGCRLRVLPLGPRPVRPGRPLPPLLDRRPPRGQRHLGGDRQRP